jgi:outer membrane protein OmpA-like peptidoglycan-associated protein
MKTKVLLILLVFISTLTFAQRKVADKFFKNYAYIKASELYEDAVKKGDDSEHVLTRLGDCYYNNSNSQKAAIWYKKALLKYPKIQSEYIYKYIQTQRSLGNFEEASKWLKKFQEIQVSDSRVKGHNPDNLEIFAKLSSIDDEAIVDVENLSLNTEFSDFGAYIHGSYLYFTSARNIGEINKNESKIEISNILSLNFNERLGKDIHEGTISITNDGKTMYFTRVNTNKRNKLDFDIKGTTHLKIYRATFKENSWGSIVELPFNNEVFSTGNPALSPDNTKLYFVSDKDGGFGQTDIYVVDILKGNTYSKPRNLGNSINTEGREMFPFIAKDSTLYFSSDGYLNLGLLDIFKSNILKDKNATPENLGGPFNSGADDFAFYIDSDVQTGFFSSNREGGKGNDDIYSFASYKCKQTVNGIARDLNTNEPLPNVMVELINEAGKIINTLTTSVTGEYDFEIDCKKNYSLRGNKADFKDDVKSFTSTAVNDYVHNVDLFLEYLIKVPCEIVINPIFFDFDKWNIRADSKYELENIVDVMREHPTMIIKIESHTDSRGSDRYNLKLSDRRSKSTKDYLLSRGIDPNRIESAIGFGEAQLLNECSNGVKCSKTKHEVNRRSYFKIVNCDKKQ